MSEPKWPLVLVRWLDHTSDDGWRHVDEYDSEPAYLHVGGMAHQGYRKIHCCCRKLWGRRCVLRDEHRQELHSRAENIVKRLARFLRRIADWLDPDTPWNEMWAKEFDRPELL